MTPSGDTDPQEARLRILLRWIPAPLFPLCIVSCWVGFCCRPLAGLAAIIIFSFFAVYVHSLFPRRHRSPEDFPVLLTGGPYGHIRHPFYSCFIFIGYGAALLAISPIERALNTLLTIPLFTFLARKEEGELLERWGDRYRRFMEGRKMFIPGLL